MPALTLQKLNKSFGETKILEDINLGTTDGEMIVLLGPSGCGKSTLLRLIAGLEDADGGEILIGGNRVDQWPPRKRNVALVFQNYALYPHMTVEKNLAFPLKIAKVAKAEIKKQVIETAELLGLEQRLKAYPAELSGGQRQRVALGRAIIRKPDLFLLDEPLSNLDANLRLKMRREIVALQKQLKVTTLYVTHDQIEALTMADRIVVLNNGMVQQLGSVDQIYNNPANIFVATFIGTPKINLLPAAIKGAVVEPFKISKMLVPSKYSLRKLIVGIRPEDIIPDSGGRFVGRIIRSEYLGDKSLSTISFIDHEMTFISPPNKYNIDDEITFSVNEDKLLLFDKENGENISA